MTTDIIHKQRFNKQVDCFGNCILMLIITITNSSHIPAGLWKIFEYTYKCHHSSFELSRLVQCIHVHQFSICLLDSTYLLSLTDFMSCHQLSFTLINSACIQTLIVKLGLCHLMNSDEDHIIGLLCNMFVTQESSFFSSSMLNFHSLKIIQMCYIYLCGFAFQAGLYEPQQCK